MKGWVQRTVNTRILEIDAENPQPERLEEAAAAIWHGGIVAAPTDTVYGLFADPANGEAVGRIYEVKGRDFRRPLILLVADMEMVERLQPHIPDVARKAMEQFWPGGLTVILEKTTAVPDHLLAGGTTVGLRLPAHPVTTGLIEAVGFPLASTSANRSGQPAAANPEVIAETFADEMEMVINSGPAPVGRESSVVDFTQSPPLLVREGCFSRQILEAAIGRLR